MKFAVSLCLSAVAYAASPYPEGTSVTLKCDNAQFDQAGGASGGPADINGCSVACQSAFDSGAVTDATGHISQLTDDAYAGCSFPATYSIDEPATVLCPFTSSDHGDGFFMVIDPNVMVTDVSIISAILKPKVSEADSTNPAWKIYIATSAAETCGTTPPADDSYITGESVDAAASGDVSAYQVDMTDFYKSNHAANAKMYVFVVPGGTTKLDVAVKDATVATVSNGPTQIGVSTACGGNTDCTSCAASCHWCQLTVGTDTSGLCGVTEGQCTQSSPFGTVDFDQCVTPDASSTTAKPTNSTTAAGASSTMMLSVAGAVLLGAALAL